MPTFAEAGVKNFGLINFTGLWAPKGTPQAVIDRLQKEIATAMATPDMKAFAESIASEPGYWDAAAFAKDLAERTAYWGKVAANTRVRAPVGSRTGGLPCSCCKPPEVRDTEVFTRMPDRFRRTGVRSDWADANRGGQPTDSFLEGPVFDACRQPVRHRHPVRPHLPHRPDRASGSRSPSATASRTA